MSACAKSEMRATVHHRRDRRRGAAHRRRVGRRRVEHAVAGRGVGHRADDALQLRRRQGGAGGARGGRDRRRGAAARADRRLAAGRVRHRQRDVAGHARTSGGDSACADPPNVLVDRFRRGRRAYRGVGPRRPGRPRPARRVPRAARPGDRCGAGRSGGPTGRRPHRVGRPVPSTPTSRRCRRSPCETSVEEDFDRGLRMLLDGIATRRRTRRRR